eukprot:12917620-Alexandrium_andersonii.AAC.1
MSVRYRAWLPARTLAMPDVSMAHAKMVAGRRSRASGSRAPACCISRRARSLVASGAPATPRPCSAK